MATTAHPVVIPETSPVQRPDRVLTTVLVSGIHHWHLLSLDAPTVAVLWTWFLARANHVLLPPTAIVAMGFAVWMLYAADRLLDSRTSDRDGASCASDLEPRHHFHRRHQQAFRFGILIAAAALAALLPHLAPESIHLYLILGALLIGYFLLIHATVCVERHRLPKEIAVGLFFSAATFIPTVSRAPALRPSLLPVAILFAVLCSLNCLFIYAWEHPLRSPQTHTATRIALRLLPHLTITAVFVGLTLTIADRSLPWLIPAACVLGICLLSILHRNRLLLSPTTLRAAADLCLLTPILLIPLLRN